MRTTNTTADLRDSLVDVQHLPHYKLAVCGSQPRILVTRGRKWLTRFVGSEPWSVLITLAAQHCALGCALALALAAIVMLVAASSSLLRIL